MSVLEFVKSNLLFAGLLAIIIVSGFMSAAYAPIYMKYGDIKGDVTESGHKDWIIIESYQFGVGRSISLPTPANPEREVSAPSVSEIVVTKIMDSSSVPLFMEALAGQEKDVIIHFVETIKEPQQPYLSVQLRNTLISGYSVSSGGDRPTESLSMSFTKIDVEYTPFDKKGDAEPSFKGGYDLITGQRT